MFGFPNMLGMGHRTEPYQAVRTPLLKSLGKVEKNGHTPYRTVDSLSRGLALYVGGYCLNLLATVNIHSTPGIAENDINWAG